MKVVRILLHRKNTMKTTVFVQIIKKNTDKYVTKSKTVTKDCIELNDSVVIVTKHKGLFDLKDILK